MKLWDCSNKRFRINLAACFGQNWVLQRAAHTDRGKSHPVVIPTVVPCWEVWKITGRGALGMEKVVSLKSFKTMGHVFLQKQLVMGRN